MDRVAQAVRAPATRGLQRVAAAYNTAAFGEKYSTRETPLRVKRSLLKRRAAGYQRLFTQGPFFGSPLWRFISVEAPLVAGTSVLPVPKYAFAGPGGVLPLLTSLLAPLGPPLPALDVPVPPPPAANAKLGTKISATVAKDLSFIEFLRVLEVSRDTYDTCPRRRCYLGPGMRALSAG
jgi:hypothetical protein